MASACVNNVGMSPEIFLDCPPVKCPSYGWLSPKISYSREFPDEEAPPKSAAVKKQPESHNAEAVKAAESDPDPEISVKDFVDFEFQLEDPVRMLAADELFSDGKLMPLHISTIRQPVMTSAPPSYDVRSADTPKFHRRHEISPNDPYLFSPKAPTCSIRWKELLRLKKLYQTKQDDNNNNNNNKTTPSLPSNRNAARSLKHFLHRSSKSSPNTSSIDSSLNLPLLKESENNNNESISISSRLSLSSSSSGHDHDDLPRLSLDSDKPNTIISPRNSTHQITSNLSKVRVAKHRTNLSSESTPPVALGVSMDSPRMNSSGKIVFNSLERSSSSPSTFNGGPRYKYRGMERSYSANVRITPVLNVPVCKSGVFGFPLFSSQQKKDSSVGVNRSYHQQYHSKNRTDRT